MESSNYTLQPSSFLRTVKSRAATIAVRSTSSSSSSYANNPMVTDDADPPPLSFLSLARDSTELSPTLRISTLPSPDTSYDTIDKIPARPLSPSSEDEASPISHWPSRPFTGRHGENDWAAASVPSLSLFPVPPNDLLQPHVNDELVAVFRQNEEDVAPPELQGTHAYKPVPYELPWLSLSCESLFVSPPALPSRDLPNSEASSPAHFPFSAVNKDEAMDHMSQLGFIDNAQLPFQASPSSHHAQVLSPPATRYTFPVSAPASAPAPPISPPPQSQAKPQLQRRPSKWLRISRSLLNIGSARSASASDSAAKGQSSEKSSNPISYEDKKSQTKSQDADPVKDKQSPGSSYLPTPRSSYLHTRLSAESSSGNASSSRRANPHGSGSFHIPSPCSSAFSPTPGPNKVYPTPSPSPVSSPSPVVRTRLASYSPKQSPASIAYTSSTLLSVPPTPTSFYSVHDSLDLDAEIDAAAQEITQITMSSHRDSLRAQASPSRQSRLSLTPGTPIQFPPRSTTPSSPTPGRPLSLSVSGLTKKPSCLRLRSSQSGPALPPPVGPLPTTPPSSSLALTVKPTDQIPAVLMVEAVASSAEMQHSSTDRREPVDSIDAEDMDEERKIRKRRKSGKSSGSKVVDLKEHIMGEEDWTLGLGFGSEPNPVLTNHSGNEKSKDKQSLKSHESRGRKASRDNGKAKVAASLGPDWTLSLSIPFETSLDMKAPRAKSKASSKSKPKSKSKHGAETNLTTAPSAHKSPTRSSRHRSSHVPSPERDHDIRTSIESSVIEDISASAHARVRDSQATAVDDAMSVGFGGKGKGLDTKIVDSDANDEQDDTDWDTQTFFSARSRTPSRSPSFMAHGRRRRRRKSCGYGFVFA